MLGRVVDVSGATPRQSISYWTDGLLKSVKDELSRTTDYNYDQRGRLLTVTAPPNIVGGSRAVTSYQYTLDSLVNKVIDPMLRETTTSYDPGGRPLRVTQPDPNGAGPLFAPYNEVKRDAIGNVMSTTDGILNPQSKSTNYTYDAWFRPLKTTDANGANTATTYDVFGNVLSVTDPLNNVTNYAYNKLNQLTLETKITPTLTPGQSYLYDFMGNMRSTTDRAGKATNWSYDDRYRVTTESSIGGTNYAYTYDAADRLKGVTDSNPLALDFQFVYDTRGQLQLESQDGSSLLGKTVIFDRDYDSVGNQTRMEANIGGTISTAAITGGIWDFTNSYTYDGMNRLTSVAQNNRTGANAVAPKLATFSYNAASQVTDLRRYSNVSAVPASLEVHTRNAFDGAGRLTSITHSSTEIPAGQNWSGTSAGVGTMLAGYFLAYDQGNRITSLASQRDGFKTNYAYDNVNQLTAAVTTQIAGLSMPFLPTAESYNLDPNGNRKSATGGSQTLPNTHNQLQSDGTYSYIYDGQGNVTRRTTLVGGQVTDYTWDNRNRLTSVTNRTSAAATTTYTQKVEYIYDAFDRRIAKRLDVNGSEAAPTWDRYEAFVWAGDQEVLRLVDSDGAGTAQP